MSLQWIVAWNRLLDTRRHSRKHPLSDPLDGAEWQGLQWAIPLLSKFSRVRTISGRTAAARRTLLVPQCGTPLPASRTDR